VAIRRYSPGAAHSDAGVLRLYGLGGGCVLLPLYLLLTLVFFSP